MHQMSQKHIKNGSEIIEKWLQKHVESGTPKQFQNGSQIIPKWVQKKHKKSLDGTPGTPKSLKVDKILKGHAPKILGRVFAGKKSPCGKARGR